MQKKKFIQLIGSDTSTLENYPISIIGGGGKSTLMLQLCKELLEQGLKVILTSTTKFQPPANVTVVLQNNCIDYLAYSEKLLLEHDVIAIGQKAYDENRLSGVNKADIADIRKLADIILIEADGSRQKGLKTHREFEPVISTYTKSTIIVVGADIVGQPLSESVVHRAELFSEKWEIPFGAVLTPHIVARELISPYSYLKNVPFHSEVTYLINKSDKNPIGAKLLAENLMRHSAHTVYLGSLKNGQLKNANGNTSIA